MDGSAAVWAVGGQQVGAADGLSWGRVRSAGRRRRRHTEWRVMRCRGRRFGRSLISKERTENKDRTDHDQNAGPPIAFAAEHHESDQQHPDPAAGSAKQGWTMTKTFMSMHEISFGYA